MDTLKLTFPSLQAGQEFMLDTHPSAIAQWMDSLAFADIDHAINELSRIIRTLNRSEQKVSHREENFYTLDQGYLQLSRHFREQNDQRSALINSSQYKALHNLSTEMAFASKRLVKDLSSQKILLKKTQRIAKAVNYAQHYLGIMLIEQYQLYAPIPSYIWRELHMLYSYAEKNKFHQTQLMKDSDPLEPLATIELSYIRNCLMSAINPYHIEDQHHWHLFKYLAHWSDKARMTSNISKYSESQCFIIDLTDSNKPHFASDDIEYEDESMIRLLITTNLLATLAQQLEQFNTNKSLPLPGFYTGIDSNSAEKLLQRIYAYCDHHVERKSARYPIMADVDTVWGLKNVMLIVNQEDNIPSNPDLDINLQKILANDYEINIRWQAVNHSDGGMCIKQIKQDVNELSVGNLVLLKRHINNLPQKQWQLAISRWLNGERNGGATVGLEFIHGETELIFYLTKNKEGQLIKHPTLLVKPFDSSYPLLITSKNLIGGQKIIQLLVNDEQRVGHLTNVIENSSALTIFGVRLE